MFCLKQVCSALQLKSLPEALNCLPSYLQPENIGMSWLSFALAPLTIGLPPFCPAVLTEHHLQQRVTPTFSPLAHFILAAALRLVRLRDFDWPKTTLAISVAARGI